MQIAVQNIIIKLLNRFVHKTGVRKNDVKTQSKSVII